MEAAAIAGTAVAAALVAIFVALGTILALRWRRRRRECPDMSMTQVLHRPTLSVVVRTVLNFTLDSCVLWRYVQTHCVVASERCLNPPAMKQTGVISEFM